MDAQDHNKTKAQLIPELEQLQNLIANLPVGIFRNTPGPAGCFIMANPAIARMFGYDRIEDFLQRPVAELYQDPAQRQRFSDKLSAHGEVTMEELLLKRADGSTFWGAVSARAVRDQSGAVAWFDGLIEDITDRKRTEEALKESERRLADIINFLPVATFVIDREGKVTAWNRVLELMTGVKAEAMVGQGNHEYALPFYGERRPILIDLVHAPREEVEGRYQDVFKYEGFAIGETFLPNLGQDGINVMVYASELRDSQGRRTGGVESIMDITERKRAEAAMTKAKEAAEAASRAKSAFLTMMSHETRTPMNAIIGMAELLKETELKPEQRQYLEVLQTAGDALLALLNDILDLSKIEGGLLELQPAPVDLPDLIEKTVAILALRAKQKDLELKFIIGPQVPQVILADAARLRQVLINLTSNAIKFTERGGITIKVTKDPETPEANRLRFSIADTGIGIAPDRREIIFEKFSPADTSNTRKFGGAGLGLAISSLLVENMGGRIWVESKLGRGSTFFFTLNYTSGASDLSRDKAASDKGASDVSRDTSLSILLVDDAPQNRMLVKAYLKKSPHRVDEAEDGRAAVDKFKTGEYDLILMDIQMPVMDGLTATRMIRAWEKENRRDPVPIVAVTADSMIEHTERSFEAGCDAHLAKPIKKEMLLAAIEQYGRKKTAPEQ